MQSETKPKKVCNDKKGCEKVYEYVDTLRKLCDYSLFIELESQQNHIYLNFSSFCNTFV